MDAVARQREAIRLLSEQPWFALATIDRKEVPLVSYIPFTIVGVAFGIVVSRLAAHSAPLLARRSASVLLVDSGSQVTDAYARLRFSIAVNTSPEPPGSGSADAIWSALEQRHGETVRALRDLPDFNAISLEPVSGRFILGFAAAFDFSAAAIAELMKNVG